MNLIEITNTHELIFEDRLNEFLALGWRILEIKKHRNTSGPEPEFDDSLTFLLGTTDEPKFPDDYDPEEPWTKKA
jgi:hypothetical protein